MRNEAPDGSEAGSQSTSKTSSSARVARNKELGKEEKEKIAQMSKPSEMERGDVCLQ